MINLYILKLIDGRHYCGITKNITKRFIQHQCGMSKSTRNHRPVSLVWLENYSNYLQARIKEVTIKKQGVTRWLNKNVTYKTKEQKTGLWVQHGRQNFICLLNFGRGCLVSTAQKNFFCFAKLVQAHTINNTFAKQMNAGAIMQQPTSSPLRKYKPPHAILTRTFCRRVNKQPAGNFA